MSDIWHIITVRLSQDQSETAAQTMYELGCNGCLETPSKNDGMIELVSYFDANQFEKSALQNEVEKRLSTNIPSDDPLKMHFSTSAVTDWSRNWRQWFKPFEIVDNVIVSPSWENYVPSEGSTVITLDPGMAFGTGLHPTTLLCAREINRMVKMNTISSLLDVGTGSGLLSIVARVLGVMDIIAVEVDHEAIRVANENFTINKTGDIQIVDAIEKIENTSDLVIANILLSTLIELKDELINLTKTGGTLVLSGITHDQESEIEKHFSDGMRLNNSNRFEEWSCMTFERID